MVIIKRLSSLICIAISSCCSCSYLFDQAALGSLVWVEDTDDAWIDGEVVEANDDDVKVICQTKTVSLSPLCFINEICLALKLH